MPGDLPYARHRTRRDAAGTGAILRRPRLETADDGAEAMSDVAELYALQELDLRADALTAAAAAAEAALGEPEALQAARVRVEERAAAVHDAERRLRELEFDVQSIAEKIVALEKKLYGGGIGNPKELADLQHDVESLQRRKRVLEDQTLEAMAALEEAQRALAEAQAALADAQASWEAEQAGHRETLQRAKAELAALQADRQARVQRIDPGLLSLYDTLRRTRGGRAVARIERATCGGCRISLPMNVQQRVRQPGSLIQCPSCERILYNGQA
jgi:predicted  nucleic acid-binding Zn-ribbon protein